MSPSASAATGDGVLELIKVMDRLRSPGGCPWDREQTHASLAPYAVEEVYELLDAIDALDAINALSPPGAAEQPAHEHAAADAAEHPAVEQHAAPNYAAQKQAATRAHLREELGDVLLQVVFHARVATEHPDDPFDIDDVARGIAEKLRRRHPHVFGDVVATTADQVSANWEQLKAAEKPERTGLFDGIPAGLPELARAEKVLGRLHRAGRSDAARTVLADAGRSTDAERRLGAELVGLVARARDDGFDAATAVRRVLAEIVAAAEPSTP